MIELSLHFLTFSLDITLKLEKFGKLFFGAKVVIRGTSRVFSWVGRAFEIALVGEELKEIGVFCEGLEFVSAAGKNYEIAHPQMVGRWFE